MINHTSLDFRNDRLKEIQSILKKLAPHEHTDGVNECHICDQSLDEAILLELRKLSPSSAVADDKKAVRQKCLDLIPNARRDVLIAVLDHGPNAATLVNLRLEELVTEVLSLAGVSSPVRGVSLEPFLRVADMILAGSEHGAIRWHGPDARNQWCWQYRNAKDVAKILSENFNAAGAPPVPPNSPAPYLSHVQQMERIKKEITDSFRLAEGEHAAEKLGGNVVKLEYWKGELAVLHRLRRLLSSQPSNSPATIVESPEEQQFNCEPKATQTDDPFPSSEEIRKEHARDELANRNRYGMPQGPCQCEICRTSFIKRDKKEKNL